MIKKHQPTIQCELCYHEEDYSDCDPGWIKIKISNQGVGFRGFINQIFSGYRSTGWGTTHICRACVLKIYDYIQEKKK